MGLREWMGHGFLETASIDAKYFVQTDVSYVEKHEWNVFHSIFFPWSFYTRDTQR